MRWFAFSLVIILTEGCTGCNSYFWKWQSSSLNTDKVNASHKPLVELWGYFPCQNWRGYTTYITHLHKMYTQDSYIHPPLLTVKRNNNIPSLPIQYLPSDTKTLLPTGAVALWGLEPSTCKTISLLLLATRSWCQRPSVTLTYYKS